MLGCDIEWRQGSVFTEEDALTLELGECLTPDKRVVVITHDCDLRHESERMFEVMIGTIVANPDSMVTNARHPRFLQLMFSSQENGKTCLQLQHANRRAVLTEKLIYAQHPDPNLLLPPEEKRILKQWLAARYGRPAFPNAFEHRLRKKIRNKSIEEHIKRIIKPSSKYLVGLFLDLGEERVLELNGGEPYYLSIYVVYDAIEGGFKARESAEKTALSLSNLFLEAYGTPDASDELVLEKCAAVSDTAFTLADLRKVDQWRLEYISMQDDPQSDFIPAGEFPI